MAVGYVAEILINHILTRIVDAALEKLYERWRQRNAARGEPSPDDAPQREPSAASATP